MSTDKTTTKASAPETRKGWIHDMGSEPLVKIRKEEQERIERNKRTVPADKPTAQDLDQLAMAKEILALQAQAAQLAEALRDFLKVVRTSNIDRSTTHEGLTNCDAISVASAKLAAYEKQ